MGTEANCSDCKYELRRWSGRSDIRASLNGGQGMRAPLRDRRRPRSSTSPPPPPPQSTSPQSATTCGTNNTPTCCFFSSDVFRSDLFPSSFAVASCLLQHYLWWQIAIFGCWHLDFPESWQHLIVVICDLCDKWEWQWESEIWQIVNFVTKLGVDLLVKVGHVVNFVENHLLTRQPTPEAQACLWKIKGVRGLWLTPVFDVFYICLLPSNKWILSAHRLTVVPAVSIVMKVTLVIVLGFGHSKTLSQSPRFWALETGTFGRSEKFLMVATVQCWLNTES